MDLSINLKATNIFYRNLNSTARYVVNRGSASSSKSYSITQLLIYKLLMEKDKKIIIMRKTLPSLRKSTYEDFLKIMDEMGVRRIIQEEKQFLTYRYKNGYIRFDSLDDYEKIKSLSANYIFLEEATEFTYEDYKMIRLRLRAPSLDGKRNQLFMAFNPISEHHWIKEKVLGKERSVEEIHSTYKDNPFLDKDVIEDLEDTINHDPNYFRVYALGEWGRLINLIYSNWKKVRDADIDYSLYTLACYGLDFGFNTETALVEIWTHKEVEKQLLLKELLYKKHLTTPQISERVKSMVGGSLPIYADSAEPDRIKDLRKDGFNVKPAQKKKKKKISIDIVKRFKLIIPASSSNLLKELQSYSWKVDKDGDPIDEPIEINNHALDAALYGIVSGIRKRKVGFKWID